MLKTVKVQAKHGKVTQKTHGANRNYRYVWDVSGHSRDPSGVPVVAPSDALVIPEASVSLIFYIIFPEFLEHFEWPKNLKYKNRRKQQLTAGCTGLID